MLVWEFRDPGNWPLVHLGRKGFLGGLFCHIEIAEETNEGSYDPARNTATLPAFLEQGGAFPPRFDGSKLTATPWGSLRFTFADCDHGSVAWTSNAASAAAGYTDVSFPLLRLTRIAGTTCP